MHIYDLVYDEEMEEQLNYLGKLEKIQSSLQTPDDELYKMIEETREEINTIFNEIKGK